MAGLTTENHVPYDESLLNPRRAPTPRISLWRATTTLSVPEPEVYHYAPPPNPLRVFPPLPSYPHSRPTLPRGCDARADGPTLSRGPGRRRRRRCDGWEKGLWVDRSLSGSVAGSPIRCRACAVAATAKCAKPNDGTRLFPLIFVFSSNVSLVSILHMERHKEQCIARARVCVRRHVCTYESACACARNDDGRFIYVAVRYGTLHRPHKQD